MRPGVERELELAPERSFGVLRLRHVAGGRRLRRGDGHRGQPPGGRGDPARRGQPRRLQPGAGRLLVLRRRGPAAERPAGAVAMGGRPGHHDADDRACTPSPANPTCLPITRLDGTIMGPGAFGYGGSGELELRRGHLLLEAELAALSPRLDINDAGFLERANELDVDVVSGYLETRPRGWFQNFAVLGTGESEPQLGRRLRGVGAGAVRRGRCFATTCTARLELSTSACPAGTSSRPPTAAGSSAAGATAPACDLRTDSRRAVQLSGHGWWFLSMNGGPARGRRPARQRAARGRACSWRSAPSSCSTTTPGGSTTASIPRGAACHAGTEIRHYRFAEQDSSFVSLTTRGTYTFTSRLTFQWYGQLFLARGRYDHFREIDTVGTRPYIRRADLRDVGVHRRRGRRRRLRPGLPAGQPEPERGPALGVPARLGVLRGLHPGPGGLARSQRAPCPG